MTNDELLRLAERVEGRLIGPFFAIVLGVGRERYFAALKALRARGSADHG